MTQLTMFETADLPLFSGTAPTGHIDAFDPKPEHLQESLAKCRFCADTGVLGEYAFCWCEAGEKAKANSQTAGASLAFASLLQDEKACLVVGRPGEVRGRTAVKIEHKLSPNGRYPITISFQMCGQWYATNYTHTIEQARQWAISEIEAGTFEGPIIEIEEE